MSECSDEIGYKEGVDLPANKFYLVNADSILCLLVVSFIS